MERWEGLNRRKFPRANYPCLVVICGDRKNEDEKEDVVLTHTENVGVGGVCVVLKKNAPLFSTVGLEIDLLDLGEHICCSGKIVWNIQRKNNPKDKTPVFDIGIEFFDIREADQVRLRKVIDRLVNNNA